MKITIEITLRQRTMLLNALHQAQGNTCDPEVKQDLGAVKRAIITAKQDVPVHS